MIRDDIVKWAEKAGIMPPNWGATEHQWRSLERFAALAYEAGRKDENEECAKVCEEQRDDWLRGLGRYEFMAEGADFCADAIRARREQ